MQPSPPQLMKITIKNQQKSLTIRAALVKKIVREVVALEDKYYDEANVHFITDKKMCALHDEYFDDPSPTDCISFPLDEELMGDVFVCPETAINYAKAHQSDPYKETTLYIVHGLLHLIGYDDRINLDKRKMRQAEKRHMKHLESLDLLLRP